MPVRLSSSSVLVWPKADTVVRAVEAWAQTMAQTHSGVRRIGYFGSYATGNAGVGSDLDLVVVVTSSDESFERRAASWDTTNLPVPADLLIYTASEWERLTRSDSVFGRVVREQSRWVFQSE